MFASPAAGAGRHRLDSSGERAYDRALARRSRVAALYGVVYLLLAFRRAYNVTTAGAALRAAAVGGGYAILVIAAVLGIVFMNLDKPTL